MVVHHLNCQILAVKNWTKVSKKMRYDDVQRNAVRSVAMWLTYFAWASAVIHAGFSLVQSVCFVILICLTQDERKLIAKKLLFPSWWLAISFRFHRQLEVFCWTYCFAALFHTLDGQVKRRDFHHFVSVLVAFTVWDKLEKYVLVVFSFIEKDEFPTSCFLDAIKNHKKN